MDTTNQWVAASIASSQAGGASTSKRGSASSSSSVSSRPSGLSKTQRVKDELEYVVANNDLYDARVKQQKSMGPKMPVVYLPYVMPTASFAFLKSRFTRTTFLTTSDVNHDHPIAHAETQVATTMAQRLVPGGHLVIDIFGSPAAADKLNAQQRRSHNPKKWVPYVQKVTAKDYLRALKWGKSTNPDGTIRYVEGENGSVPLNVVDINDRISPEYGRKKGQDVTYFFKHTLYYLSDTDLAELLRVKGSRAIAVIHRHPFNNGVLFGGEVSYSKKGDPEVAMMVEQVNKLTGERYHHRDLSFLWDSKSKIVMTGKGGFVWTFHMVTEDTWIVEFTGVPVTVDERVVNLMRSEGIDAGADKFTREQLVQDTAFAIPSLLSLPMTTCVMVSGIPVISLGEAKEKTDYRITCRPLFDYLSLNATGKPRDSNTLQTLFSLARASAIGGPAHPGSRNFDVQHDEIADHVCMAFLSGVTRENEMLRALQTFRTDVRQHGALLDGVSVVHRKDERAVVGVVDSLHALATRAVAVKQRGGTALESLVHYS